MNVFSVLSSGRGKKNIVPLHALSELYDGTLPVYVPNRTIVGKAFPRCMSCLLSGSSACNSFGIGSVINPLKMHLHGSLFAQSIG